MKKIVISHSITNREDESFDMYLKDICGYNLLSPKEEFELATRANNGDKLAKDELVQKNLRFVVSIAKQYVSSTNALGDLINEGNIGLIMAAERFNPDMGVKFVSYAVWWIQKIICEYLVKNGRIIRLPANKLNELSNLNKKISTLEQKMGRNVDIIEVISEYSDEFETNGFEYLGVLSSSSVDSLDREIGGEDGNTMTLSDVLADTSNKPTDYLINEVNLKEEVASVISGLKPRDKHIMIALYGLDGNSPMTLEEVGNEHNITREMVRQIRVKVLAKLKSRLKQHSLIDSY